MIKSESSKQMRLSAVNTASVQLAPESAEVCGAVGCSRLEQLLQVTKRGETRILCPEHVDGWLE